MDIEYDQTIRLLAVGGESQPLQELISVRYANNFNGKLRALETLVAYNNAIRELPPSLFQLKRLRWLELQSNQLRSAPTRLMMMKLKHLQTDFDELCRYQ